MLDHFKITINQNPGGVFSFAQMAEIVEYGHMLKIRNRRQSYRLIQYITMNKLFHIAYHKDTLLPNTRNFYQNSCYIFRDILFLDEGGLYATTDMKNIFDIQNYDMTFLMYLYNEFDICYPVDKFKKLEADDYLQTYFNMLVYGTAIFRSMKNYNSNLTAIIRHGDNRYQNAIKRDVRNELNNT